MGYFLVRAIGLAEDAKDDEQDATGKGRLGMSHDGVAAGDLGHELVDLADPDVADEAGNAGQQQADCQSHCCHQSHLSTPFKTANQVSGPPDESKGSNTRASRALRPVFPSSAIRSDHRGNAC